MSTSLPNTMSSKLPLVSIVIPVFNGGAYLAQAIDSALAQTYPNIEIIVVNDGSLDHGETERICFQYGSQIRYVSKANGGVGSALNAAIAVMKGDYFSWLSHDDLYLPRKVETQLAYALAEPEPVVVFGNVELIDAQGAIIDRPNLLKGLKADDDPLWCLFEVRLSGCTLLVPRECFDTCGTFNAFKPTTQDYDLWYRMARRYRFVASPQALVQARLHDAQGSRDPQHLEEVALSFIEFLSAARPHLESTAPDTPFVPLRRIATSPTAGVLPAYRSYIGRWEQHLRRQVRLRLACPADQVEEAFVLQGRLRAAGYERCELSFIWPMSGTSRMPSPVAASGRIFACLNGSSPQALEALAVDAQEDDIVMFCGAEAPSAAQMIQDIDRLLAREIDAVVWMTADPHACPAFITRPAILGQVAKRVRSFDSTLFVQEISIVSRAEIRPWLQPEPLMPTASSLAIAVEAPVPALEEMAPPPASTPQSIVPSIETAMALAEASLPAPVPAPRSDTSLAFTSLSMKLKVRRLLLSPQFEPKLSDWIVRTYTRLGPLGRKATLRATEALYGVRGRIDRQWYVSVYPDVAEAGVDPTLHYLRHGWREGRSPSPSLAGGIAGTRGGGFHLNPISQAKLSRQAVIETTPVPVPVPVPPPRPDITAAASIALPPVPAIDIPAAPVDLPIPVADIPTADLLLLSDATAQANGWTRALQRQVKRNVQVLRGEIGSDGMITLRAADDTRPWPAFPQAALKVLVERAGLERIHLVGERWDRSILDLLDASGLEFDLTLFNGVRADDETQRALLRHAARVLAPTQRAAETIASLVPGQDVRVMRYPGFATAGRYPVSGPRLEPGEALRILAVASSDQGAEQFASTLEALSARPPATCTVALTLPDAHDDAPGSSMGQAPDLLELVGAHDPHLLWFHNHRDLMPDAAWIKVLRMGRPLLITGAAAAAEGLEDRPLTWNLTEKTAQETLAFIARCLETAPQWPLEQPGAEAAKPFSTLDTGTYLAWHRS